MGELTEDNIDWDSPPFQLTDVDREILSMRDEDFHRITWDDLKDIIGNNHLEKLQRTPPETRKYLVWSYNIKKQYDGITNFVIKERLFWKPKPDTESPEFEHHSDTPFADPRDFTVLVNDWPYGFASGIVHVVVWTKTRIPVDDEHGDVTADSRQLIDDFTNRYFVKDLENDGERVMWFKNWVSLQSVRGVDHVHVLARDVPKDVLERWTERRDL